MYLHLVDRLVFCWRVRFKVINDKETHVEETVKEIS